MADRISAAQRSELMAQVRARDTTPERVVRRLVCELGLRYRLNVRALPGSPDLVFRRDRKAIFVHGCFWHRHTCRAGRSMPESRQEYWSAKLARNRERDQEAIKELTRQGWKVLVIWECQLSANSVNVTRRRLRQFLCEQSD